MQSGQRGREHDGGGPCAFVQRVGVGTITLSGAHRGAKGAWRVARLCGGLAGRPVSVLKGHIRRQLETGIVAKPAEMEWTLARTDHRDADTEEAASALLPYIERELARGVRLHAITRHLHGLFQGVPGARAYRRHLATEGVKPGAGAEVLRDALAMVMDSPAELAQTAAA